MRARATYPWLKRTGACRRAVRAFRVAYGKRARPTTRQVVADLLKGHPCVLAGRFGISRWDSIIWAPYLIVSTLSDDHFRATSDDVDSVVSQAAVDRQLRPWDRTALNCHRSRLICIAEETLGPLPSCRPDLMATMQDLQCERRAERRAL